MVHPLAKLGTVIEVKGKEIPRLTGRIDELGNPEFITLYVPLKLLVKEKTNPEFKASYGLDISQILLECHIIKSPDGFRLDNLDNTMLATDGKTLTIINRGQYFLRPMQKVFGTKFLALLSD